MSGGLTQGFPQRMTAFLDPKTGLVTDAWWRFLNSLWLRTGGGSAPASVTMLQEEIEALYGFAEMADTPAEPVFDQGAYLAAMIADTPVEVDGEAIVYTATLFDDTPTTPENDPALVALLVGDA
jgi:hypothetical protein